MDTKHTPGPWDVSSGMVWHEGTPIARMDRETPDTTPVERDCNARLIAAAPELLEAVDLLLDGLVPTATLDGFISPESERAINAAHKAIAKATGVPDEA